MSKCILHTSVCSSCDKFNKHLVKTNSSGSDKKDATKVVVPKKVLISKNIHSSVNLHVKSCSVGAVSNSKSFSTKKYEKTTKSDVSFVKNKTDNPLDYCKKCGDSIENQSLNNKKTEIYTKSKLNNMTTVDPDTSKCGKNNKTHKKKSCYVQQYYKNENFCLSTESVNARENVKILPPSLDTIKEVSEIRTPEESIFRVYTDAESENEYLDTNNSKIIKELREFRNKNYFECHSTKSRIRHKPSVTSLENHKCVYRFYLNERLFPVPLNTDFNNKIRCVECHLPMDLRKNNNNEKINGTIQTKVRLGDEVKDLMLLLPAREPLIIKEKRKDDRVESEEVYFGVIKLSPTGRSIFNNELFDESLALRYQKGFRQFANARPSYKPMKDNDVVFI